MSPWAAFLLGALVWGPLGWLLACWFVGAIDDAERSSVRREALAEGRLAGEKWPAQPTPTPHTKPGGDTRSYQRRGA